MHVLVKLPAREARLLLRATLGLASGAPVSGYLLAGSSTSRWQARFPDSGFWRGEQLSFAQRRVGAPGQLKRRRTDHPEQGMAQRA